MTFRGPQALTDTFEKIHLQGLFCQKLLQAIDFFAVS